MLCPNPNLLSKRAAAEEGSCLALAPLSLANLLEEGGPRPRIRRMTTTKPPNFVSVNSLSHHVFTGTAFVASATFRRLLSWYVLWSEKNNNVFLMLRSNAIRFLTTGRENKVSWEDLPQELWGEIGKRLSSQVDILCFRSVCKKLRKSLPFPTRFPLQVPPLPGSMDVGIGEKLPCIITQVSEYSCGEDILLFEELDQRRKFYAQWMYYNDSGIRPIMVKFDCSKKPFMTYWIKRLSFVSKTYHLRVGVPGFKSHKKRVPGAWDFRPNLYAKKTIVISSNATDGVNPSYARASELTVVALLSAGSMRGRLALLRLGGSYEDLVWETDFCDHVFEDIATYRGRLCTMDSLGVVRLMDYNSLQMTRLSPPWPMVCVMIDKCLLEACDNLYLADMSHLDDIVYYKLSLRLRKWLEAQVSSDYLTPHLY